MSGDIHWHVTQVKKWRTYHDDLETFLDTIVLGAGYRDLIAAGPDDPWLLAVNG